MLLFVAVFVTVRLCNPISVRFVWLGSTGARFTSLTVTLKLLVALRLPSLTTVVSTYNPGPCPSLGVQLITPLVLIAALVTALLLSTLVTPSVYVSASAGMSLSIAVFVTTNGTSSLFVTLFCAGNAGPLWIACTVTTKLLVAVSCGLIRSYGSLLVTTVVIVFVPGT